MAKTKKVAIRAKSKIRSQSSGSGSGSRRYGRKKLYTGKQIKNVVYNNTLQDWLELHHPDRDIIRKSGQKVRDLTHQFREHVIDQIREQVGGDKVVVVPPPANEINGETTLEYMADGVPVIVDAQLVNRSEGLCDVADALVRSDYVQTIFPLTQFQPTDDNCQFNEWYYVAVAIRFSSIHFCVDGIRVRNDPATRYCKTRLYIQNKILDYYQHCYSPDALIVGRNWSVPESKKTGTSARHGSNYLAAGVVQFDTWDKFTAPTLDKGLEWRDKLEAPLASEWTLSPDPTVPELYANANVTVYDTPWAPIIHKIAKEQDDITRLHHCTATHREQAHSLGVYKLGQATVPEELGHKSSTKVGASIGRYLMSDFNTLADVPLPQRMVTGMDSMIWVALDFESLATGDVKFIHGQTYIKELVYLASVVTANGTVKQYGLMEDRKDQDIEQELISELYVYFQELWKQDPHFTIFCWSDAEARYFYKLEEKYPEYPLGSQFASHIYDLHEAFNNIILPGQTDDKLVTVARAADLECTKQPINTNIVVERAIWKDDKDAVKELLTYNSTDAKILKDLVHSILDAKRRRSNNRHQLEI